ncbi:hypothetical protein C7271_14335 [filamentous cyanobacterium CCP5]|nr:hypothetical protein C7271_14335 [filamentous cyanobacterium CCP5]
MAKQVSKHLKRLGLGLLAALLISGIWSTAAAAKEPAQVRVGQFIANAELTVQLQPQSGEQTAAILSNLTFKQISDYQSLPPGRYTLTVQAENQVLLRSTYGLGAGDRYTLTLYGLRPEQPVTNPRTFMAQLKRIFGGAEANAVNDYLPQMALLHDRASSQSDAPQVRLVHLAAGIVPITMEIQGVAKPLLSKQLAYPRASEAESVEGNVKGLAIALHGGEGAISSQPLPLTPQTLTDIFAVGGLTASQPIEIVVADPVSKMAS